MRIKIKRIGFYFSVLIFPALIGSCVTSGPIYFPKSLETTPLTKLVKVKIPDTERIVMVDNKKISSAPIVYVSPGIHTYTFKIKYRSSTYCNGPSYGLKAERDILVENGKVSSVVTMDGNYEMDVSAKEGQTVEFKLTPELDCKAKIRDYFKVVVSQ